jgi:hypothetical protein
MAVDSFPSYSLTPAKTEIFRILTQIAILVSVQNALGIVVPFCLAIVYVIQKVYLRTSRQLRFLYLESQSAVYSGFLDAVSSAYALSSPFYHHTWLFHLCLLLTKRSGSGGRRNHHPGVWMADQDGISELAARRHSLTSILLNAVSQAMAQLSTQSHGFGSGNSHHFHCHPIAG